MTLANTSNQINNLKSLAGSIAHETRNPLTAIQGCCDIIKNNLTIAKDNLTQALEFIDLIAVSSTRGLSIADLILSNIREEKIDEAKFVDLSIARVIESAIKEFAFESEKEKALVNLNLENDFTFKGDETLMIFVLFNLLKNSLYYKAKIDIWLESDKRNIEGISFNYLYFKDCGIGIPKDKLPHIFESFFTSNKKGGTGLGLPFCKRVLQAFGGDIACKSIIGKGVEFCLKFTN